MGDMLVRLYDLPELESTTTRMADEGIVIRRVNPWEAGALRAFCVEHFSDGWADEVTVGLANKPVSVFIAQDGEKVVGFAAYECTRRGFFGPTGVNEEYRRRGIGTALLLACLHAMWEMGYGYAIIGSVGPTEYYARACGAIVIEDSAPGIFPVQRIR